MYLQTEQKSRIMVIDDDSGVMSLLENMYLFRIIGN